MRDFLVLARRAFDADHGVAYAARLASRLRASLTGLHVPIGVAPLPAYDVDTVMAQYAAWAGAELERARALAPGFEAWAASLGVAHPSWLVADGPVGALVRYVGHWHDLLVVGADPDDPWTAPGGLADLLLDAGLPCVVVPAAAPAEAVRLDCVAVAWNGSVEAIRALHAARPLLQQAARVQLLVGEGRSYGGSWPAFPLERWCEAHGLAVVQETLPPVSDDVDAGEAILASARGCGAELLVLGAYGRSRLSEWALGGVTRHLLRHSPLPLLMRH